MTTNCKSLTPVKQLHHIYPDIQGELCSRHSTLFGKLRTTFNKLYDSMEPQHYVIVKGSCQFVEQDITELKLSMALENGAIMLVSKTYPTSQIFVNCNHFGQQVIFSYNGKLQQGLNSWSDQMQKIIQDATTNLAQDKLHGGILYIHVNIPQNSFSYKQTFLMAFYISILSINNNLNGFTTDEIVEKMANLKFLGTKQSIERQFLGYKNRKFNLTLPNMSTAKDDSPATLKLTNEKKFVEKSQLLLDMQKTHKFLFCKLDLAKQDVNYEFRRRKQIQLTKKQILKELKAQTQVNGLFELFNKISEININDLQFSQDFPEIQLPRSFEQLQCDQQEQILHQPHKFLQILLRQIGLVSQFSNENIDLQQLVSAIWEINSKYLRLHSDQVVELVQDMKQRLQLNGCMVVNQNFLMIVVQKSRFTQLICEVKQKMNKGELKSKSLFKIQQQDLVVQRWSSDKVIGQKMFTSVPSEGMGIFDPSQSIWFD